jgi:hypothetical protein
VSAKAVGTTWSLVTEDRATVLAALRRGECDGLLPAAIGFLDDFATFLDGTGILDQFEHFPDPRPSRSIAPQFFCNVLLHKCLFRLPKLADIERVLFQSPDVLRRLGFNFRQIHAGFYHGSQHKPFNSEALADFFNEIEARPLQEHQLQLSRQLLQQFSWLTEDGTAILDANTTVVPPGHYQRPGAQLKACVLGLRAARRLFPLLWDFTARGPGEDADLTQGKRLIAAATAAWGEGTIRRIIVDRGFIDGAWISALKAQEIDTIIGLRENMDLYQDMLGLCQLDDAVWIKAPPPQRHEGVVPQRTLCHLTDLNTWEACTVPLQGLVIRDTYPDRVQYQCLVTTDLTLTPPQLHQYNRDRWSIEESFMDLTRYWPLEQMGSCRPAVARAQIHFLLLAYTLLHLFAHETEPADGPPRPHPRLLPGQRVTAYYGDYYTVLWLSELMSIILDHHEAWQANREQLLAAQRFCEGHPQARAPD